MSSEVSRMKLKTLKVKKLQNELLNAVKKFDSKKVMELVALKVNVNIVDQYGNHLIFVLLKEYMRSKYAKEMQIYNYKEKAKIILKCLLNTKVIKLEELFQSRKQDPKEKFLCAYSGYTPLMIACLISDKNLVNLLIEYGNAYVNTRSKEAENPLKLLCPQFKVTNEPIQEFSAVMAAMVGGNIELIRYLVEKGATLSEITPNGWYPFRLLYLSQLLVNPFDADFVSELLTMGTVVQINSSDQETIAEFRSLLAQRNLLDEQVFQRLRNLASCERYFSTVGTKIKLIFESAANKTFNFDTLKPSERGLLESDDIMDDKTCFVLKSRTTTLDNFLHVVARSGNVDALKAGVKLLSGCKKKDQLLILCAKNSKGASPIDCAATYEDLAISNEMLWILQEQIIPHLYPLTFRLMTMKSLHKISDEILYYIYLSFLQGPNQSFAYQEYGKKVIKEIINVIRKLFEKNSGKEMLEESEAGFQHYMTGVKYSYKLDKNNQKRAMTHFCLAAQKLFTPAMEKVALYYAQGEIIPQNVALAEKILKKLELMHNEPHPYIKARIPKLKEAHQKKLKDKIQSEKNIAELENPKHYVAFQEGFYDKWCDFVEGVNKQVVGPHREKIKFMPKEAWQSKPYFITPSDQFPGLYNLVIFFYRFENCKTVEETIKLTHFEFIEILIKTQPTHLEIASPQEGDKGRLVVSGKFNTLDDLLKHTLSRQEVMNFYIEYLIDFQKRIFKPFDVVTLRELQTTRKSLESYIRDQWKQITERFTHNNRIILEADTPTKIEMELKIKEIQDHPYFLSKLNKDVLTKFITERSLAKVIQETTPSKKDLKNDWFQLPFVIWPYFPKAGFFKWTALYFKYPCNIEQSKEISNTMGVDIFLCEVTQMFRVTPQGIAICEELNGEIIMPNIPPHNNFEDFIQDMCSEEQGAIEGERYTKDAHNYKIISLAELRGRNISISSFIKQGSSHQFDFKSPQQSIALTGDPPRDETFSREDINLAETIKASEESARQEEIERAKKQSSASVQNEPMVKFSISRKSTVRFNKNIGLEASGKSEFNINADSYEQVPASKNKKS